MKTLINGLRGKASLALVAVVVAVTNLALSTSAMATATGSGSGTAVASDGFDNFEASMLSWVNGPLGVGLAVTSLLVGGGVGILRSTPLPAVAGLALAAMFAWGPQVIVALVSGGAMVG